MTAIANTIPLYPVSVLSFRRTERMQDIKGSTRAPPSVKTRDRLFSRRPLEGDIEKLAFTSFHAESALISTCRRYDDDFMNRDELFHTQRTTLFRLNSTAPERRHLHSVNSALIIHTR
jgi:hypothetical protein